MPSSDYTTTGGGLKLKGAQGAGIEKKKKKKSKKQPESEPARSGADEGQGERSRPIAEEDEERREVAQPVGRSASAHGRGKTEAERRHDEMRKKRLDERLKKDGVKTHKERVEELNKYLSGLSEHHDMPRIGPG